MRLLNGIFAKNFPFGGDIYFQASMGINAALSEEVELVSLGEFAKRILSMYDSNARVETVEFSERFFDPLFELPKISTAAKRLAGGDRGILVVSGLGKASLDGGKNFTSKSEEAFERNRELIEGTLARYLPYIANFEIIYI